MRRGPVYLLDCEFCKEQAKRLVNRGTLALCYGEACFEEYVLASIKFVVEQRLYTRKEKLDLVRLYMNRLKKERDSGPREVQAGGMIFSDDEISKAKQESMFWQKKHKGEHL